LSCPLAARVGVSWIFENWGWDVLCVCSCVCVCVFMCVRVY
jgi:hypothetical protein